MKEQKENDVKYLPNIKQQSNKFERIYEMQ